MRHKDGFILFMAEMPNQFAFAADEDLTRFDAEGWMQAYRGFETHSEALADAEDTARSSFEAACEAAEENGEEAPTLEEVERDTPLRARFFEDGRVHVYDCAPDHGDAPAIGPDEPLIRELTHEEIYAFTGQVPPVAAPAFGPGLHACNVEIRMTGLEEFVEHFGVPPDEITRDMLAEQVFLPMTPGMEDLGASLRDLSFLLEGSDLTVRLEAEIFDPRLFSMKIAEAGRDSGHDADWTPPTAADAIFEGWFGSNEVGSPADMGFEILSWRPAATPSDEGPAP